MRPRQQLPGRNSSGRKEDREAGREKALQDNEGGNNSSPGGGIRAEVLLRVLLPPSASNLLEESQKKKGLLTLSLNSCHYFGITIFSDIPKIK